MHYELTAKCDDWWDSSLKVTLYETVPDPGKASLKDFLEVGVRLHEKRKYTEWTVTPWGEEWTFCDLTANGVKLKETNQPFLLQYGFVQFTAVIMKKDGSTQTLRSKYCSAFQTDETENLKKMTQEILKIREKHVWDMLRWPSPRPGNQQKGREEEPETYSMISGALQQGEGADSTHLPLKRVLDTYRKHSGYFKVRPEYTIRKRPVATPFHRVKALTNDSMAWSARNGSLRKVETGGIQVRGQRYLPMETLSEVAERDYHIYENRVILGFLDTVVQKINEKEDLKKAEEFDILRMIFSSEEAGWDEDGVFQAETLRRQYQRALNLEKRKIPRVNNVPKQTKRFQEILPYREIYRCIYEWFHQGTSWGFDDNSVFRGNLANTLYEYFCWLQLLQVFWGNGYRRCRDSRRTDYGDAIKKKPPFSNIVYLEKEQTAVTLYFEPRISTWKGSAIARDCGISLIRTAMDRDKEKHFRESFWTPDFLIRVEQNGRVEFGVLDAKFRSIDMLQRGNSFGGTLSAMEESLYKYYLTTSDAEKLTHPVRMLWLLQGRAELDREENQTECEIVEKKTVIESVQYFPKTYFENLSVGILSMNSYNSEAAKNRLWEELKRVWPL